MLDALSVVKGGVDYTNPYLNSIQQKATTRLNAKNAGRGMHFSDRSYQERYDLASVDPLELLDDMYESAKEEIDMAAEESIEKDKLEASEALCIQYYRDQGKTVDVAKGMAKNHHEYLKAREDYMKVFVGHRRAKARHNINSKLPDLYQTVRSDLRKV